MKKTVKVLISIILVAVVAFSATSSAFADETQVKTIEWTNFFGDDYTLYYGEKALVEGANEISVYDSMAPISEKDEETGDIMMPFICVYYDFEAKESGYYHFNVMSTSYAVAKSFDGNNAEGYCEGVNYGDGTHDIIYIEKGKTVIGTFFTLADISYAWDIVNIEYLGAEIEEYNIDEEALDDFIIGWNVWEDNSGDFGIGADCEMTFSSGKTLAMEDVYFPGTCSTEPKEGKNKATVEFLGIEKEIEFTAFYLENLIDSAEVTNLEKHTEFTVDYNGLRRYENATAEQLVVKFTDGTEYSALIIDGAAEVILPNGFAVPAYAGLQENYEDGTYKFVITIANMDCAEYEVTERENTFSENIKAFNTDNTSALQRMGDDFVTAIQYIVIDSEFSLICFNQILVDLSQIFANFEAFAKYYISI